MKKREVGSARLTASSRFSDRTVESDGRDRPSNWEVLLVQHFCFDQRARFVVEHVGELQLYPQALLEEARVHHVRRENHVELADLHDVRDRLEALAAPRFLG